MQQVKGAVLKSRLAFVERHSGKEGVDRVLATLSPDMQRTLRMLFTSNWYPFGIGKALDDAIVQVLGGGRPEFFERLGEASAESNLGSIHASYLTKGGRARLSRQVALDLQPLLREPGAGNTSRPGRRKACSSPTTRTRSARRTA